MQLLLKYIVYSSILFVTAYNQTCSHLSTALSKIPEKDLTSIPPKIITPEHKQNLDDVLFNKEFPAHQKIASYILLSDKKLVSDFCAFYAQNITQADSPFARAEFNYNGTQIIIHHYKSRFIELRNLQKTSSSILCYLPYINAHRINIRHILDRTEIEIVEKEYYSRYGRLELPSIYNANDGKELNPQNASLSTLPMHVLTSSWPQNDFNKRNLIITLTLPTPSPLLRVINKYNGIVHQTLYHDSSFITRFDHAINYDATHAITRPRNELIVYVWDIQTGQLLHKLKHDDFTDILKFSYDGTCILTTDDHNLNIWSTNTGELLHRYKHTKNINYATLSPDGTKVLLCDTSSNLFIIDFKQSIPTPEILSNCTVEQAAWIYHKWQNLIQHKTYQETDLDQEIQKSIPDEILIRLQLLQQKYNKNKSEEQKEPLRSSLFTLL